jgi:hypothetical protein
MVRNCWVWVWLFFGGLPGLVWGAAPVAHLSGPSSVAVYHEINLNFIGTVSEEEPEYEVALAPPGANVEIAPIYSRDQTLIYGVVIPDKVGLYRFVVIASFTDPADKKKVKRDYAFLDVRVVDQVNPLPGPQPLNPQPLNPQPVDPQPLNPQPLNPQPVDPSSSAETYGLYTFTKKCLNTIPPTFSGWKAQAGSLGDIFLQVANNSTSYPNGQSLVTDTANRYKQFLGSSYPAWKQYLFNPLLNRLNELATKGQLPQTVNAHRVAWNEIGTALKEAAQ